MSVLVTQLCLTLYDPVDCRLPDSSVHGISQARILEGGCYSLLQGIFLTQGSNLGPLKCRQIFYHLSHQGNPIHDYWKHHSFDYPDFVSKLMSLLSNTLSRFVIAFLPRSKSLLILWLQSPSVVILEPKKIKSVLVSTFPHLFAMK